jgi:hypothetical protein
MSDAELGCPHSESSMPLQPREFCNWLSYVIINARQMPQPQIYYR